MPRSLCGMHTSCFLPIFCHSIWRREMLQYRHNQWKVAHRMKLFYAIVANSLAAFLTNTFVWFAVTFWVYLETKSVVATAVMAGVYTPPAPPSGFFPGAPPD